MEKQGKSGSFIGRHRWRTNIDSPRLTAFSPKPHPHHHHHKSPQSLDPPVPDTNNAIPRLSDSNHDSDHHQILIQIDRFTGDELSTTTPAPAPDHLLDNFSTIIKSKTTKSSDEIHDDAFLYESVKRLCKLKRVLADTSSLDKINDLLHRTMMLMEQELRVLLLEPNSSRPPPEPRLKIMSSKHFSFKTEQQQQRCCPMTTTKDEDFPGFSKEKTGRMNKIVDAMISAGYKIECSNVYSMARGNALYEQLKRLEFEKLNAEDVQRLTWDWLEADIFRWIRIIKHCSDVLIPAEHRLGETVYSHHLSVFRGLFVNLIRSVTTSLLDYATAVAMTKRSAERLFKFLDMYEALHGLSEAMNDQEEQSSCSSSSSSNIDLNVEISSVKDRIGNGAIDMLGDLENSIRNEVAKTPVPGGAVHPLTRYVLNYVRYACEYGDTLEEMFHHLQNAKGRNHQPRTLEMEMSPLAAQIMSVMSLLDGNLAVKSTLYKDPSLRYIFLMNNGRYILQKVKGSSEIKKLMGDNWCRRRSSEVRHYHKSYQRETWTRLLQCITQEGIQVNGKINKQLLKDRFKNFNAMFDEIHKTQSTWVVSEEQLLSEIRASISGVVVPAYRSFVGRYRHHFEAGRSMDRYIKYQPEDIEALIETLFEGNHASMSRKRF